MRCKKIRKMLNRYVDGELSARYQEGVRRHLASCDCCERELASITRLKDVFSALETEELPRSLWPKIAKRLAEQKGMEPVWTFSESVARRLIPVAAAALLIVGFFIFYHREESGQQVALDAVLIDETFSPDERAIITDGENPQETILLTSVYGDYEP